MRVPWTARRSNQSILKEINPEYSGLIQDRIFGRTDAEAEAPNLGHLIQIADSLEKILMLVKIEGRRTRG